MYFLRIIATSHGNILNNSRNARGSLDCTCPYAPDIHGSRAVTIKKSIVDKTLTLYPSRSLWFLPKSNPKPPKTPVNANQLSRIPAPSTRVPGRTSPTAPGFQASLLFNSIRKSSQRQCNWRHKSHTSSSWRASWAAAAASWPLSESVEPVPRRPCLITSRSGKRPEGVTVSGLLVWFGGFLVEVRNPPSCRTSWLRNVVCSARMVSKEEISKASKEPIRLLIVRRKQGKAVRIRTAPLIVSLIVHREECCFVVWAVATRYDYVVCWMLDAVSVYGYS
jgi:hypothetical protein